LFIVVHIIVGGSYLTALWPKHGRDGWFLIREFQDLCQHGIGEQFGLRSFLVVDLSARSVARRIHRTDQHDSDQQRRHADFD